jgi:hypothetical protein
MPPVSLHLLRSLRKLLSKVARSRVESLYTLATWQIMPSRHVLIIRRAYHIKDNLYLIKITLPSKDWRPLEHLAKDTSDQISTGPPSILHDTHPTPHISIAVVYRRF